MQIIGPLLYCLVTYAKHLVDVVHTNLGIWYESFVESTHPGRAYDRLLQLIEFTTPIDLSQNLNFTDWPIERTYGK